MSRAATACLVVLLAFLLLLPAAEARAAVLLGYWQMEENQPGQKAVDSSVHGRLGTYNAGVNPNIPGAPGFGLGTDFRGTSSTIALSDPGYALSNLTNDFSVLAWINLDSASVRQRIMANSSWGFGVRENGGLLFTTYGVRDYVGTSGLLTSSVGSWVHVAAVMNASNQVSFYLNGILDTQLSHGASGNAGNSTSYIGGVTATGGGEAFNGRVDQVAVFSGALTQAEIAAYMTSGIPTPKHAVFRYDYHSSEPLPAIPDDSGAGHPGTSQGAVYSTVKPAGFPTPLLPGGIPQGTGDRSVDTSAGGIFTSAVNLVNNANVAQAGGFTMETWVYRVRDTNAAGLEKIIDMGGVYRLQLSPSTDLVQFSIAGGTATLPVGEWHHVAAVFDSLGNALDGSGNLAGVARFFFDGQQIGTDTATTLSGANDVAYLQTRPIGIGRHPTTGSELFQGLLYDTRVMLGALSPGEFLLAPVPEPSGLALGASALLGLAVLGARRRVRATHRSPGTTSG